MKRPLTPYCAALTMFLFCLGADAAAQSNTDCDLSKDHRDSTTARLQAGSNAVLADCLRLGKEGNPRAQTTLGHVYWRGWGVKKDLPEAISWYLKAAEQGEAEAKINLGILYEYGGAGVQKDYAKAMHWYTQAARHSDVALGAYHNIGVMHQDGHGVPANYSLAAQWYRKAAEAGYSDSQHNLGLFYMKGMGVGRDLVQAYLWLSLAASKRAGQSAEARDSLASKMNPGDLARGEKLVREWKPKELVILDGNTKQMGPNEGTQNRRARGKAQ